MYFVSVWIVIFVIFFIDHYHCQHDIKATCKDNLIVAGATGYSIRDVRTFLLSYNISRTSHSSKLLLLFSDSQRHQFPLQRFLQILDINLEIVYISSSQHVGNFRFQWLKEYLENQQSRGNVYCTVFSTDMRDVYFQDHDFYAQIDSYRRMKNIDISSQYVILSQEGVEGGKRLIDCQYHVEAASRSCIKPAIKQYDSFMQNNIICSGAIIGSSMGMITLLSYMLDIMTTIDAHCLTQPMTDQIILNMIIYETMKASPSQSKLQVFIPDNFHSPMLTMGYIPPEYFTIKRSKTVFTNKSDLGIAIIAIDESRYRQKVVDRPTIAYVHQYDRFPEVRKTINFGLGCGNMQYFGDNGNFVNEFDDSKGASHEGIKKKRRRPTS